MPCRLHPCFVLLLAVTLLACTTSEAPLPDEFVAGPIDSFPSPSVVTFADRIEVERATGDHLLGGNLVFHLVRLGSGDVLALSACDPHSDCWTIWDTDADLQMGNPPASRGIVPRPLPRHAQ
jgi:hypothetical protein